MDVIIFYSSDPPPDLYTLSLHDALPIYRDPAAERSPHPFPRSAPGRGADRGRPRTPRRALSSSDRKSTRLNSSHRTISYAVFCSKKKKPTKSDRTWNASTPAPEKFIVKN